MIQSDGGDDVDAGFEQRAEQVDVRPDAVEVDDVGLGGEHVVDVAGGDHADRVHADDLAGVPADLVGRVAVEADQLEVGMPLDPPDHLGADIAGGDLEHPDFVVWRVI